ncbi:MAG TPA: hypothetical protein VKQ29_14260 [Aliidongia sp.]|nr:hypothetical protein [Aliidongia sp.]
MKQRPPIAPPPTRYGGAPALSQGLIAPRAAQPKRLAPPPPPLPPGSVRWSAPVLQRAADDQALSTLSQIRGISEKIFQWSKAEDSRFQEAQTMYLEGDVTVSSNALHADYLKRAVTGQSRGRLSSLALLPPTHSGKSNASMLRPFNRTSGLEDMLIANPENHAEQNLLKHLVKKLAQGTVPTAPVVIGGSKPPCNKCHKVLTAFRRAYDEVYTTSRLVFLDRVGDASVTLEPLDPFTGANPKEGAREKFESLKSKYKTYIAA